VARCSGGGFNLRNARDVLPKLNAEVLRDRLFFSNGLIHKQAINKIINSVSSGRHKIRDNGESVSLLPGRGVRALGARPTRLSQNISNFTPKFEDGAILDGREI
jgi:hypothetical protein